MFLVDLMFAFIVALLLSLLFIPFTAPQRSRDGSSGVGGILFFFLVLFLASWAGGLWLTPLGPPLWGAYWAPVVFVGVFVALLLAAASEPSRRYYLRHRSEPVEANAAAAATAFGLMFWILMIALVAAVIAGYGYRFDAMANAQVMPPSSPSSSHAGSDCSSHEVHSRKSVFMEARNS